MLLFCDQTRFSMFLSQSPLPKLPIVRDLSSGKFSNSSSGVVMVKHFQENSNNILINGATGSKLRVAYQGVPGAYSEVAALKAYPNCETVPCHQFEDAIKAAERGWVEKAVIPIENSIGGSIHTNYDLLLRHRLHIVGETHLLVNHCLLALPGVTKEELMCVLSHPQALVQCEMSLTKLGVARIPADNTAAAAQIVASQGVRENGAIASARSAEIYGLDILAENFQDRSRNVTRFLKLARKPIIPTNDTYHKTSIVFTLEGPKELHKALAVFALRGIDLSKIESRPQEKHPLGVVNGFKNGSKMYFNYLFFIDIEASVVEPRVQNALADLQEFARSLQILGCYPIETAAQRNILMD
ncbi:hypothetical protein Pfo_016539 [Paulownia fortunei]|nr:hypothetical protein Pfo_016539 [Paulownia fortunei]